MVGDPKKEELGCVPKNLKTLSSYKIAAPQLGFTTTQRPLFPPLSGNKAIFI